MKWTDPLAVMLLPIALTGCVSTKKQLLQSQIALHDRAIVASQQILDQLQQSGAGPYQLRAFVRLATLNAALAVTDGLMIRHPDLPDVSIRLGKVRLERFGAFPAAEVDASASRGKLDVNVSIKAALVPTGNYGEFRLEVLSFTPRVSFLGINFTKARFVRELLAVEAGKLTATMPAIKLPVEQSLALGAPASAREVRFQTSDKPSYLTVRINVPSTEWRPAISNIRYFFIKDGVYIFGEVH